MPMMSYSSRSPYYNTPQNNSSLGYYVHRQINPDVSDTLVVVDAKYAHRPDLLSYDLYGTVDYWWVFAVRNMDVIKDPIFDLKSGVQIFVPSAGYLSSTIL